MRQPHLHFDLIQSPARPPESWTLLLHGIYGAGRNWGSVARRLAAERPDRGVALVDLRSHGKSPRMPPPQTIEACARDLEAVEAEAGMRARSILGHSFGGKVALLRAGQAAGLEQVWVIDSTPSARKPSGSAWEMLSVLRHHPGPFADREEAVAAVASAGYPEPVARWMATNVAGTGDQWRWRLDADDMEALLLDFFGTDAWSLVEAPPPGTSIHFVKATGSQVLDEEDVERIRRASDDTGRVLLHRVEGGHWLNADNPDALLSLLTEHL